MKKGFSSNSSPKTFSFVFSARGTALKENLKPFYLSGVPLYKKPCRKSLERGLGKNLSPERVAPAAGINFCIITGVKQPQINFVLLPTLALSKSGQWVEGLAFLSACSTSSPAFAIISYMYRKIKCFLHGLCNSPALRIVRKQLIYLRALCKSVRECSRSAAGRSKQKCHVVAVRESRYKAREH